MAMIFLSFIFFVLIMVTWKEPTITDSDGNITSDVNKYVYNAIESLYITKICQGCSLIPPMCNRKTSRMTYTEKYITNENNYIRPE